MRDLYTSQRVAVGERVEGLEGCGVVRPQTATQQFGMPSPCTEQALWVRPSSLIASAPGVSPAISWWLCQSVRTRSASSLASPASDFAPESMVTIAVAGGCHRVDRPHPMTGCCQRRGPEATVSFDAGQALGQSPGHQSLTGLVQHNQTLSSLAARPSTAHNRICCDLWIADPWIVDKGTRAPDS